MGRHSRGVPQRVALIALAAAGAAGCVGQIGGSAPVTPSEDAGVAPGDAQQPSADVVVPLGPIDPGRVTLHRLNRVEYNNTVRDLLGTRQRPADEFPADDRGYGYDNIADVLSLSPLQVEMYQRAAEVLIDEALAQPRVPMQTWQFEGERLMGTAGAATANAWNLYSNGDLNATVVVPAAGRYRITIRAWQSRGGTEDARMGVEVDGAQVHEFRVPNLAAAPAEYVHETMFSRAGSIVVGASFLNDFYDMATRQDRNLYVDWIRVEGPIGLMDRVNPARERILTCDPVAGGEACARTILARFGRRAWRRPLADSEVTELLRFLEVARMHRGDAEAGVRLALQAILLSPHFLFRVETDPDPRSPTPHPLNDHELAARLSYFLWSTMPDEPLDAAADAGRLRDPAELRRQVDRMLADPRSRALVENFAGQWLFTRALAEHAANPQMFPQFDAPLRTAMRAETENFFDEFLRTDVGMDRFLTADFTYVDGRLATHYGLTPPAMQGSQRVSVAGTPRGAGILTHGSFLTVTSHGERTSPVRRGQWVLTQLLCTPPPPPPPGVEGLPTPAMPTGTLRQRLEEHRRNPECAACHTLMDPIGFGLENFDAIGAHRTQDQGGFPIDARGELPDGERFDGAIELGRILAQDPRYARCVTQQLMTYALGRGLEDHDRRTLDAISAGWMASGMRLRDLVGRVVESEAFRMRRGEPDMGGGR